MGGVPGIMARFILALTDAGIPILQTTDSDNLISAIVKDVFRVDKAAVECALTRLLNLGKVKRND